MVGRLRELARLGGLLKDPRPLLVTLTGPGGSGKTRLAIEAASEVAAEFSSGVFFVELAAISEPGLVVSEIAQTLGIREGGHRDLEELLQTHLETKSLLLVLDNFEQVVEAAPIVARLMRGCPRLAILVTSRATLRLTGEREFPVVPLELPNSHARTVEEMEGCESVALFVERARAVSPEFVLTERTAPSVADICLRLDGLPLAIELAAARVKLLDPPSLLAQLGRRLPLLTGGPRDAPERQRTLRAAIQWSDDLLDQDERRDFTRLAVFAGTFSLEAAEAVTGADLETLAALVDESLLKPVGEGRFLMLETIREYAQERLEGSGQAEQLLRAHGEYFLTLAERAETELSGPEQIGWLDLLEADHDNLRAALEWLGDHDTELQARLTVALRRFWYVRGHLSEARRWLDQALGKTSGNQPMRRRALTAAAALALIQGEYEEATRLAEESVDIARVIGESADVANALSNLGAIVLASGDHQRAEVLLRESVTLARGAGNERIAALAINNLGDVALTVGDYRRAEALFEESLSILRGRADMANVARSLFNLGAVALRLHRHSDALERLRESSILCRQLGDKEDLAWCLEGFAALAAAEGDPERAAILLGAAGRLLENMGAALKPFERQLHEETAALVNAGLSDAALTRAMERGASLATDEAVGYALGDRARA
jgi:non-specific serine/threonine protein kinase